MSDASPAERLPDIEGIQDVVEQTLICANHFETARSYIVYREQRAKLRDDRRTLVDVASSINEYLDRSDWRVKPTPTRAIRWVG